MLKLHDQKAAILCVLLSVTGFACLRSKQIRSVHRCQIPIPTVQEENSEWDNPDQGSQGPDE